MFKTTEGPRTKKQWYQMGQLLPILTANALLADKRFIYYIEQIKQLCGLTEEHFHHFYPYFIQRFAEFVQLIPEQLTEPVGSLLTNGLLRGLNTLHLFVKQMPQATPLERYALFTACVLRDISHVVTQQKIFLTDEQGITVQIWQPFCGPLTEEIEGSSYKIIPLSSAYQRLAKSLRVTLARQVMGESGFLWIASNLRLLMEWLEALDEEDEEGSGRLVQVIRLFRRQGGGLLDSFPITAVEIETSPATEYGDQFYVWLIEGINDGSIKVNRADAEVHVTEAGVFIETPAIFKTFKELYEVPVNHYTVYTQFGNLIGIARKGGHDYQHAQLFSEYPDVASPLAHKTLREGILIADVNSIYTKSAPPPVTPYVKVPASIKESTQALAQFNEIMKPNTTLKNR